MGEMKGSGRMINPEIIIVTSNYSIDECFEGPDIEAIKRRYIEVEGVPTDDLLKLLDT